VTALLVALGPLLVVVGIGVGIAGIGSDDFTMVTGGLLVAAAGMVVTLIAFVVLRRSAQNPGDIDDPPQ